MTAKELAEKLDGKNRIDDMPTELIVEVVESNLVAVYGDGDDLMEFAGTICDEVSVYGGGTAYVTTSGLLENDCEDEDCPYFKRLQERTSKIEAVWCPRKDGEVYASWLIKTDMPHEAFDIMEDGELYCRGIVFCLDDAE